ncbi:putative Transcription factor domain-containing protein [Seiridium cardinale]|uniref:Transcription factor domain-containing protein n=1 Tax=Seiridium cardinale TaxID=138064 RepID=A0ABR2XK19_9PEZI
MSRAVRTASRLVTSDDEIVSSLEGIECVMIESMYYNNTGNLRRAWLINRRAMVLAQIMGLHAGNNPSSLALESGIQNHIDPDYMWFRLVTSDRYLSLMLGLPQGSLDNVFARLRRLENCTALERLERMESAAAGRILQRNSAEKLDFIATYKIDQTLQEAAALMSPQWWLLPPGPSVIDGSGAKAFEEIIRVMTQFAHQHLLVQLYLPYVAQRSSASPDCVYGKMTAAIASRTILARFVAFRNSILGTSYCRGVDFIVLFAATALCLVHIQARRGISNDAAEGVTGLHSLTHQRLSDRGLLESVLDIMETTAQQSRDAVAQKISSILKSLLAIDDKSAGGTDYHVSASSKVDHQEPRCPGNADETSDVLCIEIPYFGTIKIGYSSFFDDPHLNQVPPEDPHRSQSISQSLDATQDGYEQGQPGSSSMASHFGFEISNSEAINADWQTVPSYQDLPAPFKQHPGNSSQFLPPSITSTKQETHVLVPGLEANIDNWVLQGVDMALFRSLGEGSTGLSGTSPSPRTQ